MLKDFSRATVSFVMGLFKSDLDTDLEGFYFYF